jgi:hypothetical protein
MAFSCTRDDQSSLVQMPQQIENADERDEACNCRIRVDQVPPSIGDYNGTWQLKFPSNGYLIWEGILAQGCAKSTIELGVWSYFNVSKNYSPPLDLSFSWNNCVSPQIGTSRVTVQCGEGNGSYPSSYTFELTTTSTSNPIHKTFDITTSCQIAPDE